MRALNLLSVLILYAVPNFTLEKSVHYTEEEVAAAQDKIEQEMPVEIHRVLYESAPTPYVERIRAETPEFRRKMVEFARKMAYPLPGCTEHTWENGLFMYRDEATVRKFVSKWFDEGEFSYYGKFLGDSADPEVIRLMGPHLFDESPVSKSGGFRSDVPVPKNEWVAGLLGQYTAIEGCVEFPEEVRVWNRRLAATGPPTKTELAILQRWWKENEAAFQAREYDKVKPGVLSIPGMRRSVMGNPPNFETTDAEPLSPPNATSPANKPRPMAAAPIASGPQSSVPSRALLWSCAVLAVALLAGLFFLWKRRG